MTYNFKAPVSEKVRKEVKELMDEKGFEHNRELFLYLLRSDKEIKKKYLGRHKERLEKLTKKLERVHTELEQISYYLGNLSDRLGKLDEKINKLLR